MEDEFIVQRQPMISGQGEAAARVYRKYLGKSGRTWLVAVQDDPADNVYVSDPDPKSQGFGGATLTFTLEDGSSLKLKGPWHSNPEALYTDTGVDVRNKCLTFVVISRERDGDTMRGIVYKDEAPQVGLFKRGEIRARLLANQLSIPLFCYSRSAGGSSSGAVYPDGWTKEQVDAYWEAIKRERGHYG